MFYWKNEENFFDYIDISDHIIKKWLDSDPISNKIIKIKYIKTKMSSYNSDIKTDFHDKEIPKEGFHYICLSMILIDSFFEKMINILCTSVFRRIYIHY